MACNDDGVAMLRSVEMEQSCKEAQGEELKPVNIPTSVDAHSDEFYNPICYLPKPGDKLPEHDNLQPMGPIGAWATGKVNFSPMAGLTGARPAADRYSITRFSPNEWRAKNLETIRSTTEVFDRTTQNESSCKSSLTRINALVEKAESTTTRNLRERVHLVGKWRNILETAIKAMQNEISNLEEERLRLKKSLLIIKVPESIAKECLDRRCSRPDTELVRDAPEEELIKELALIAEIRQLLNKTLEDFDEQQKENRAIRERLEYDWSDKKEAYEMDGLNANLNNRSTTILFRHGATRHPPEQTAEPYWEHFSRKNLEECEKCRQKSCKLRQTLNSILLNAARDLRTQADVVENALAESINCIQVNVQRFENDLKECLQKLAHTETRLDKLRRDINNFDSSTKLAQTRLYQRSFRPNIENCRDIAQQNLIDEVVTIQNGVSTMLQEADEAEAVKNKLMQTRSFLEREIKLKRHALMLDRERCMLLRTHYPSANALSGYASL